MQLISRPLKTINGHPQFTAIPSEPNIDDINKAQNLGEVPDFAIVIVYGTFVGTLQFTGTWLGGVDGLFPVGGVPAAGGAEVSTVTVPGFWVIPRPSIGFSVITTAWTSGTANVVILDGYNSLKD